MVMEKGSPNLPAKTLQSYGQKIIILWTEDYNLWPRRLGRLLERIWMFRQCKYFVP